MFVKRLSKALRIISIAPIMAIALLTLLYITHTEYFGGFLSYILAVLFLGIFPILAYPMQPFIPGYRDKGRDGQRSLAMVMAGIGYCMGIIAAVVTRAAYELSVIYLTYFISGLLIILFNKVLKIRASGHTCGVAGPIFAFVYFGSPIIALLGLVLLSSIYWASLNMKRHSLSELMWGTAIPGAALLISLNIASLIQR